MPVEATRIGVLVVTVCDVGQCVRDDRRSEKRTVNTYKTQHSDLIQEKENTTTIRKDSRSRSTIELCSNLNQISVMSDNPPAQGIRLQFLYM